MTHELQALRNRIDFLFLHIFVCNNIENERRVKMRLDIPDVPFF